MNRLMKKCLTLAVVAALAVGTIPATQGFAQEASVTSKNTILVYGNANVLVKPDIAYVNIGVETKEKVASVSQQKNKDIMDKVIKALKNEGIKSENMSTENYSLYRSYDYVKESQVQYYMTTNTLKVTVTDFDKIGKILDVATAAGANNIYGIRFALVDESKAYDIALDKAIKNATDKANRIAKAMGKSNAKSFKIGEMSMSSMNYRDVNYAMGEMAKAVSTPIQSGDIVVSASLSVEYEY